MKSLLLILLATCLLAAPAVSVETGPPEPIMFLTRVVCPNPACANQWIFFERDIHDRRHDLTCPKCQTMGRQLKSFGLPIPKPQQVQP